MVPEILVIDDHREIRKLFQDLFSEFATTIDTASNCCQGLSKAISHNYSLIFVDANLGDITGFEYLRILKAIGSLSKVAIMSSYLEKELLESYSRVRADAYLEKPLSLIDILICALQFTDITPLHNKIKYNQRYGTLIYR